MKLKDVLLDTDILSYIMKKKSIVMENYQNQIQIKGSDSIYISRISVIEILGGLKARNANRQIADFQELLAKHKILDTTELSAIVSTDIFAELTKKGKHSGNYDILIAGIAIANNLTLITNNEKDYENISGLDTVNWTLKVE